MSPNKKCVMNGNKIEQYSWNGKCVTYVNNEKTEETYLQACDRLYNSPKRFKFQKVYCSQCGKEFGPRDSGYSHCEDHRKEGISI